MNSLTYQASFGYTVKTIDISPVQGAAATTWHVYVDNYYTASVMLIGDELRIHPVRGNWMSGDDVGALREVMEMWKEQG